jgi:hypothetical protein
VRPPGCRGRVRNKIPSITGSDEIVHSHPCQPRTDDRALRGKVVRSHAKGGQHLADAGTDRPEWAISDKEREIELTRRVTGAVFVISPFRDIVDHLRKVVGRRLLSADKRLGTIRTTQGKEADIVILVLGTSTD